MTSFPYLELGAKGDVFRIRMKFTSKAKHCDVTLHTLSTKHVHTNVVEAARAAIVKIRLPRLVGILRLC